MNNNIFPKKILLINAFYHIVGGADTYFFNLAELLREKGHDVIFFCMDHPQNRFTEFSKYFVSFVDFQNKMSLSQKLKSIPRLFWSFEANKKLRALIREEKPDIAHIHNIHYEISPSIIHELKKHNIPIVMTLHDYVLVCPLRTMFVRNELCERCKNRHFFNVVKNKCIRNSYLASLIVYLSFLFHKYLETFSVINLYISPSQFLASKFKETGFQNRIAVLPYCYKNLDKNEDNRSIGNIEQTIIYFGRLQFIKGIEFLIEAVKGLNVTLKIIGRGSTEIILKDIVKNHNINNVIFLGYLDHERLKEEIKKCLFTVIPSIWYENYSYAIIESFILGKPVIGSNRGGIPELITDGYTGVIFNASQSNDLRKNIQYLLDNPELVKEMGNNAKKWIREIINYEKHYQTLELIYTAYKK